MRLLDKLGNAIFWGLLGWDSKDGKITIPSTLIDKEPEQEPEPQTVPTVDMTLNEEFNEFVRKEKENREK